MSYKTLSSYEAYNRNILHMYTTNQPYFMSTDLGNGRALPEFMKPEAVPKKIKKKIVKPGDQIAQIKSSGKSYDNNIYGKLLFTDII